MIKILLSGEGPTDCGRKDCDGSILEGPVIKYMRSMATSRSLQFKLLNHRDANEFRRDRSIRIQRRLPVHGHALTSMIATIEAIHSGYDVVAYYVDSDTPDRKDPRKEFVCRERYNDLKREVEEGFAQGKRTSGNIKTIAIIPVKMIESWMLSDSSSIESVARMRPKSAPCFPSHPELEWGDKKTPSSNYPKCKLTRILSAYGLEPVRETYCEIAAASNIGTLIEKCPISFAPFAEEFNRIMQQFAP